MSAVVKYKNGSIAEDNIVMRIQVIDQNDNPPVFDVLPPGNVSEGSPPGTFITQVRATDKDDPATLHTAISYSIIKQEPEDTGFMFNINSSSGQIHVWKPDIDRERCSSYVLTVKATDMNGHPGGLTGTGTVTVKVLDINDNMPTLEKDEYEASVNENTANVEVLRIKALDSDLEQTDNWLADFEIASGNEDGTFSIETDPKTNEGVLILRKEVDFEQVPNMQLGVVVRNKAPFQNSVWSAGSDPSSRPGSGGTSGLGSLKRYPIKVNVRNLPDPPRFVPKVKAASIPEDSTKINLPHVIATYPVIDGDSGTVAKNIWYAKDYDPEQLLSINETTAEVKLNKVPDRESKFVKDGIYYAKVIGVMKDFPYKTATGTIAIEVQDSNDHCPHITSSHQLLCSDVQAVTVTAVDEDSDPNAAPFGFTLVAQNPSDQWKLETFNDTAAVLKPNCKLESGSSKITLVIKDHQGLACSDNQVLNLDVCTCTEDSVCGGRALRGSSISFGSAAIGAMLLGIILILLIPLLLLFCNCGAAGAGAFGGMRGGFTEMPFSTKEHLIAYHTEGKGEDKEVPLLNAPIQVDNVVRSSAGATQAGIAAGLISGSSGFKAGGHRDVDYMDQNFAFNTRYRATETETYEGIALPDVYLEEYYSKKASIALDKEPLDEKMLVHDCEGQGSLAGSVGCCSLLETLNFDLEFLNDLGPKFKTLADICRGPEMEPITFVPPPLPPPKFEPPPVTDVVMDTITMPKVVQPTVRVEKPVVETSYMAPTPNVTVRENVVVPKPTYIIQQPVNYTTTPVVPTTQYVFDPQVHNTVLVADRPSIPSTQTMYLVNSVPAAENMVITEKRVVAGPVGGGLVEGSVPVMREGLVGVKAGVGNLYGSQNLLVMEGQGGGPVLQPGTLTRKDLPGSQNILLVEEKVGPGQVLQGGGAWVQQGSLARGNISGPQNILLVEKQGGSGQVVPGGTATLIQGSGGKMTFNGGSLTGIPSVTKVISKEKKIVSTKD
ncbi:desmoglein-2.1-like isoform X2 [Paramormyrops kingsleyae]